ncbi:1,4-alpha-glucan branching protein GlgB [Clostridium taeniosporum]|uniref:1,4-alpha-glucan branching enzyme GlgB n=1 Tax=Clostridium taeniosporum TaxID=394958 RepID=A0A1D7XN13_9CLOT|nr:1,4-alpha-glucan branching protein GlgB [Clostridium taeniosporum]AOR24716.1 1,4-alpha-glucan branching enzyme [Clostridium taeniosporum]
MSNTSIKNIGYKLDTELKKVTSEKINEIPKDIVKDIVKDTTKTTKKVGSSKKSSRTIKKKSSSAKTRSNNNTSKEIKSKAKKSNSDELNEINMKKFHEGKNYESYKILGSHIKTEKRKKGVRFTTWAPNAKEAYLVGDFNNFEVDKNYKLDKIDDSGLWSIFLPKISSGTKYKYCFIDELGNQLEFKSDPYAIQSELRPNTASIVCESNKFKWNDKNWINTRDKLNVFESPINIYEMHLGSWKRDEDGEFLTYEQLSETLPKYLKDMGYTYVELMPLVEHPLDASWGYQGTGYYSPTSRYGDLNGLKTLVEKLHDEEIGVIFDWVPGHFCKDSHGLYKFDGTPTYEYSDEWRSENCGWGTCNFDLGKSEVRSYLISNALYWIREFHMDGIRVDAVSSILYLDYDKQDGEWIPNEYGSNANLEGIEFLRQLNKAVLEEFPNVLMIAEESTAWPNVSKSNSGESLCFNFKWNMGWMNDTLEYIKEDPIFRRHIHNKINFSMMYNYSENFILPISHDEVVHGKKSLVDKMWGDYWNKFSGLRLFASYMMGHPGKKLLFMGCEFGQFVEWREYEELQWFLIDKYDMHRQTQEFFRDLNHFYIDNKALWELDYDDKGFTWIDADNNSQSILEFIRRSRDDKDTLIFISNFTPVVYYDYKVGVPFLGEYEEVFNTDDSKYGGSGQVMGEILVSEKSEYHNQPYSLQVKVPPMATLVLKIKSIYIDIEEKTFMKKVTEIAEIDREELLDKIEDIK